MVITIGIMCSLARCLSPIVLLLSPHASGADVRISPTPQKMSALGAMLTLSSAAKITGADAADGDAVRLLRERLAQGVQAGTIGEVVIGERGEPAVKEYEQDLPEISGAYKLMAKEGRLVIVGHDARGTFYGMQTLRQLLDADANPADLPAVEILDYPDVSFRGVVEGFYGTPWTHENRLSQFAFYGRHKLDTYIYGPKDDPFHSSPNWRKPYPEKEAARIRELASVALANKVNYVWAIHPGKDIRWTPEDYQAVKDKFQSMYDLGVRSFAVFFDDISGEGTNPEKQADLLNWLNREFVKPKGDVTPLIMCPTEYNKSWANPKKGGYLEILGDTLDPSIQVMWTGDRVIADFDKPVLEWINPRIKRKSFIWWNYPVTDYARNHLLMGPVYGNSADIGEMMSGFVSNPMELAEASKVALYGVSDYAWNVKAYDSQRAWEGAIKEVMPEVAGAFRTFCAHNCDVGPSVHGYRRDESVEIKPSVTAFLDSHRKGKADAAAIAELRAEFKRIAEAPAAIRAGAENPRLIEEISPWLDGFEQLGVAGQAAMDGAQATDKNGIWAAYARASEAMDRMTEMDRTLNHNPYQPGVRTGSLVLVPLVQEVLKTSSAKILTAASGKPVTARRPISNSSTREGMEKMVDGEEATYYESQQVQKEGDWFGMDMGAEIPVSTLALVMGRRDGDRQIVLKGQWEISTDGESWKALGEPTAGERVSWEGRPVHARQVRYRVVQTAKPDGSKNDGWCAIRRLDVNPMEMLPNWRTSIKNLMEVPVRAQSGGFETSTQFEVFALTPGAEFVMVFPYPVSPAKIQLDLGVEESASLLKVERSEDGKAFQEISMQQGTGTSIEGNVEGRARMIGVRYIGKDKRDAKLAKFRVEMGAGGSGVSPLVDGSLDTSMVLKGRQVIEIPRQTRGVTLLFANGAGKSAKAGVASTRDGAVTPLGEVKGDLSEFVLPQDAAYLVLTDDTGEAKLREVVWR